MSRIVAVLVLILFVSAFTGIAYSVEKENKIKLEAGVVKALDAKAKTITLSADNKTDFTCFFDDKTAVRANTGKKITTADIKVGDVIVLLYEEVNGKKIAKSVTTAKEN